MKRIEDLEKKGRVRKRDLLRDSCIDEGYAELEGNDTLYVYGNAYEIVLSNSDFHPIIKKVVFSDLKAHIFRLTFSFSCLMV